jgi:hypothetical protein
MLMMNLTKEFEKGHGTILDHTNVAPRNEGSKTTIDTNVVELILQFYEREKMSKGGLEGIGHTMVISLESCKNIKSSLAFFDMAKGGKIVLPLLTPEKKMKNIKMQCKILLFNLHCVKRKRNITNIMQDPMV